MMEDVLGVCTEFGGKKEQIEILEGAEVRLPQAVVWGVWACYIFQRSGQLRCFEQFLD